VRRQSVVATALWIEQLNYQPVTVLKPISKAAVAAAFQNYRGHLQDL